MVWMKPQMSAAPRARPKAWLSTPSDQCLQRAELHRADCEKKRDPRSDGSDEKSEGSTLTRPPD